MASLVAFRSAIRASRATLTASRAVRCSTAAGLSAADLARAARPSWAFFASAAAHEYHLTQEHTKRMFAALEGKMSGVPTLTKLSAL